MCVCTRGCVQGFDSGLCVKERETKRGSETWAPESWGMDGGI